MEESSEISIGQRNERKKVLDGRKKEVVQN